MTLSQNLNLVKNFPFKFTQQSFENDSFLTYLFFKALFFLKISKLITFVQFQQHLKNSFLHDFFFYYIPSLKGSIFSSLDEEIRKNNNLMKIIKTKYLCEFVEIGILKVLIDKKEAGRYLGRTEFDSVEVDNEVVVHATKKLQIGEFVMVKITKAYDYDLEGEVVG